MELGALKIICTNASKTRKIFATSNIFNVLHFQCLVINIIRFYSQYTICETYIVSFEFMLSIFGIIKIEVVIRIIAGKRTHIHTHTHT